MAVDFTQVMGFPVLKGGAQGYAGMSDIDGIILKRASLRTDFLLGIRDGSAGRYWMEFPDGTLESLADAVGNVHRRLAPRDDLLRTAGLLDAAIDGQVFRDPHDTFDQDAALARFEQAVLENDPVVSDGIRAPWPRPLDGAIPSAGKGRVDGFCVSAERFSDTLALVIAARASAPGHSDTQSSLAMPMSHAGAFLALLLQRMARLGRPSNNFAAERMHLHLRGLLDEAIHQRREVGPIQMAMTEPQTDMPRLPSWGRA